MITVKVLNAGVVAKIEGSGFKIIDDPYTGPYEVNPEVGQDVILPTINKSMIDDVTIHKIQIYTTANESGGNTVIIGG